MAAPDIVAQDSRGPSWLSRVLLVVGATVFMMAMFRLRPGQGADPNPQTANERLYENSGLVQRRGGGYWAIADSGSAPVLYAIDAKGVIVGMHRLNIPQNIDWEDIASDRADRLFIGDIGDNHARRKELNVVEVKLTGKGTSVKPKKVARYRFRYPKAPASLVNNRDAEGLFFLGGQLYLFTKRRGDTASVVYRFTAAPKFNNKVQEGHRVMRVELARESSWFHFGDMATAAALDHQARRVAILTYRSALIYEDLSLPAWNPAKSRSSQETDRRIAQILSKAPKRWALPLDVTRQCEGVEFQGDKVVLSNEDGDIFELAAIAERLLN